MELKELKTHFVSECQQFSTLCEAIFDHAVPSCPGWTVQDLLEHLGTVQRRGIARIGSDTDPTGYDLMLPSESSEMLAWFNSGWSQLYDCFEKKPPEYPTWNWSGKNQTLGWLIRRQAHEAAIHRYDAELARIGLPNVNALKSLPIESIPSGFSPQFAKDGIDERLEITIGGRANLNFSLPGSIHLHATDIDAEWTVTISDGIINIDKSHKKADAAIRATASELYLWSWGRLPVEMLEYFGDLDVIEAWKKLPG